MGNTYIARVLVVLIILLFPLVLRGDEVSQSPPIRVVGDWKYPPYEFLNESGNPDGFIIDLLKEVMNDCGYEYTLQLTNFTDAVDEINKRNAELITGLTYSDQRNERYNFSLTHSFLYPSIICRKNSSIRSIDDLKGKDVIIQSGDIIWDITYQKGIVCDTLFYDNMDDGLRILSKGYADAAMCTEEVAYRIITENKLENLEIRTLNIGPLEYCFATDKLNGNLINKINVSLAKLKANGVYDQLYAKWFGVYAPQTDYTLLFIILSGAVFIGIVATLFILLLRRQVKIATRKLQEKEIINDLAIRTAKLVLWVYDTETQRFTSFNDPINDYDSSVALSFEEYRKAFNQEDLGEVWKKSTYIVKNRIDESFSFDVRVRTKHSHFNWEYCTVIGTSLSKDKSGKVLKYVGLRQNNNRLIQLINDLEEARDRADESNRLKSSFLANMSHEIRTPLNAIVGFSNLLASTDDLSEKDEYCEIINANNELLLRLINDVLDLSKIEAGCIEFHPETFDVVKSFNDLYTSFQPRIESLNIDFLIDSPYDRCMVNLDEKRLLQVISNFITNAIKFTEKGFIKIGFLYENEGLRIYCTDTGIGISPDKCAHVFDRFYKVDNFAQGTGLGMSICKSIVNAQKGEIGIDSEEGVGSTFWAWIPCKAEKSL